MWRHRSRDYLITHMPYGISYWWSFGTVESLNPAVFEILRSKRMGSRVWPFIWYPICHFLLVVFGTKLLSLTVFDIFNVECNAMVDMTLIIDTTSKRRSRSIILVPIDFSYTTSYRLSIVTFALGRTVYSQYIPYRRRQTTADAVL